MSKQDLPNNDDQTTSVTNVSGGMDVDAQGDVAIGGDAVGRDKVVSAGTYIEHAEFHYHGTGTPSQIGTALRIESSNKARLFISYKRNTEPDQTIANELCLMLTQAGHSVFLDKNMLTGADWLAEIDQQIKASDYLIVLLSQQSADSEMVKAEVARAYEYRRLQGRPQTLPVRVNFDGLLPYSLSAFLNPLQYVTWQSASDTEHLYDDIRKAIAGQLPEQMHPQSNGAIVPVVVSDDGRVITSAAGLRPPLPEFDPRFLEDVEVPGGAVKLSDKLYIEREADSRLREQLKKKGTTTTIRAPRQTGKTSLLMRGIQHARAQGSNVVFFDLQASGHEQLASLDTFLRVVAEQICDELGIEDNQLGDAWQGTRGTAVKLQRFLEKQILPGLSQPIIFAMDEADSLLKTSFYTDFFGLLRSWHNRRAVSPVWEKFNMVLVISTEPYLLIDDVNRSPFNVGLHLNLSDFTFEQVRDLNMRHGTPISTSELAELMNMLQGQPYLTRKTLYSLTVDKMSWAQFVREAPTDYGPFGDHLRHQYWNLHDKPELKRALKEIINSHRCADDSALFRLLKAGLITGVRDNYKCRCGLYESYFKDKLT